MSPITNTQFRARASSAPRWSALLSAAVSALSVSFAARAAPAKERVETPICVDVVVQRAPVERAANSDKSAAPAASTAPAGSAGGDGAVQPADGVNRAALDAVADLDPKGVQDPRVQSGANLPLGQTPEAYLKRLLEHYVTHEVGFVAAQGGCQQHIVVELYPLRLGWTAFARYSGTGREERIDQLLPTELPQFAERAVLALLHDTSINHTVDRNNVLWADSLKATQSIRGRGHVVLGLGTRLRGGLFDTVVTDAGDPAFGRTKAAPRLFSPMLMNVGYRGQFEEFGVEAAGELALGTSLTAARRNPTGGHIDYGGSVGAVLHAVRYADVRGLTSLYYGGGATFALHWFSAIQPEGARGSSARSTLFSGGLDIDGVLGYEFMRASAVSFFLQGELNLPAYAARSENASGAVNTWFPGAALKLGAVL